MNERPCEYRFGRAINGDDKGYVTVLSTGKVLHNARRVLVGIWICLGVEGPARDEETRLSVENARLNIVFILWVVV